MNSARRSNTRRPVESPGATYTYAAEGDLVRIEAITTAGVAGVWHVSLAEALDFAIKQAKEAAK